MTNWKVAVTLKEEEELMIPPDGAKRELVGVIYSILLDDGCAVLDGELTRGSLLDFMSH